MYIPYVEVGGVLIAGGVGGAVCLPALYGTIQTNSSGSSRQQQKRDIVPMQRRAQTNLGIEKCVYVAPPAFFGFVFHQRSSVCVTDFLQSHINRLSPCCCPPPSNPNLQRPPDQIYHSPHGSTPLRVGSHVAAILFHMAGWWWWCG
jgi:hypothetical protein